MSAGIKVSRQGYDVNKASDKQLAFSSEWPLLPIEAEGTFDVTNGTSYDESIYTHGLGYVPVFMYWLEVSGKLYQISDFIFPNVWIDDTELYIDDYFLSSSGTLHWKIFRRDLLTNYDSGNLISTDATEEDSGDIGILVSQPSKSVWSNDKRDFSVRSDTRQLMIHMTGYTSSGTLTGTIEHDLGYQPMYWFYGENTNRNPSGSYSLIQQADDFTVTATTTELSWRLYTPPGINWAYLIFKDPVNEVG